VKPARIVLACVVVLLCFVSDGSWAKKNKVKEFSAGITATAGSFGVFAITAGPDGNLWFTETDGHRIGRITTAGVVTEFSAGITGPPFNITSGPDGNLWFTEAANSSRLGRITTAGVVTYFTASNTLGVGVADITAGPDGNLWYTESNLDSIGRMSPITGAFTEFSAGINPGSGPFGIATGPDGNLWFTEFQPFNGNRIGRITPAGVVTQFSAGITAAALPIYIAAGPDGNLWFTEPALGRVARITTAGVVTEFSAGITAGQPYGIRAGPDGNVWFTETLRTPLGTTTGIPTVARITPAGVITEFSKGISAGANVWKLTTGPDNKIWFTEGPGNRIARLK
jgi:virginiamycin B lyase